MRKFQFLVPLFVLSYLVGCSSIQATKPKPVSVPSIQEATQIVSTPLPASELLASEPKLLPVTGGLIGGVSTRGILVPQWAPFNNSTGTASTPGSLLVVDPSTGHSVDLMGSVPNGVEPISSRASGQWVVWVEGYGMGGPETLYSDNLTTGKVRTLHLPVSWVFAGANLALEGSTLYWASFDRGSVHRCDTGEIGTISLRTGRSSILLVASSCGADKMRSSPPILSTTSGHFPIHLKGAVPTALSFWDNHLVFSSVTGIRGISESWGASALVDMDLQSGSLKTLLSAPPPLGIGQGQIGDPAVDADMVAFDVGTTVYVYNYSTRKIALLEQGALPTVSGPYVTWQATSAGPADLYDLLTGNLYVTDPASATAEIFGNTLFWYEQSGSPPVATIQFATVPQPWTNIHGISTTAAS